MGVPCPHARDRGHLAQCPILSVGGTVASAPRPCRHEEPFPQVDSDEQPPFPLVGRAGLTDGAGAVRDGPCFGKLRFGHKAAPSLTLGCSQGLAVFCGAGSPVQSHQASREHASLYTEPCFQGLLCCAVESAQ